MAKKVSLVPRLMTAVPKEPPPTPIRLHGLSPDQTTTGMPAVRPYFVKYAESLPATVFEGFTGGSLLMRSGAVAAVIAGSHSSVWRFSRFMPAPSP